MRRLRREASAIQHSFGRDHRGGGVDCTALCAAVRSRGSLKAQTGAPTEVDRATCWMHFLRMHAKNSTVSDPITPAADRRRHMQGPAQSRQQEPAATGGWSKLIDAETIETEIKRLAQAVATDVTTPSEFKGGKYQDCRRHFSVLAMLFAVAAEYDGDVRWQDVAAGLRDVFARAGHNCKVGTDSTYREATQRKADLSELVAGSRPQIPQAERIANWSQVADRPPLMQRMNIAHEDRLTKWLANEARVCRTSRRNSSRGTARGSDCRRDRPRGIRLLG